MPRIFAQHATAGIHLLETRYCEPTRWEWTVFEAGKMTPVFSGDAPTLDAAKRSAAAKVGQSFLIWKDVGAPIDLPDA